MHGKDCSRVELLIESRKRKSKISVNDVTLAKNMNAVVSKVTFLYLLKKALFRII